MERCLEQMQSIREVDQAYARRRGFLPDFLPAHLSQWPTPLAWGIDSTTCAIRLLLAGQVVGAAIIARQQLERWTLLLAAVYGAEQGQHESAERFIGRTWELRTAEILGEYTADVCATGRFDDFDDAARTASGPNDGYHEHFWGSSTGREICPPATWRYLTDLIDGTRGRNCIEWETLHRLDPAFTPSDADDTVQGVSDALELCIIHLRLAAADWCDVVRDHQRAGEPPASLRNPAEANYASEDALLPRPHQVPQLAPAIAPLTQTQLLTWANEEYLASIYTQYKAFVSGGPFATARTVDEVTKMGFVAHRFARFLSAAMELDEDWKVPALVKHHLHKHFDTLSPYMLTSEMAALAARWNQSRPELASAAMLISSTLRSGYWLWLEGDDRGMGILRSTLAHAARFHTWHFDPRLARELESADLTAPTDWMQATNWPHIGQLDAALYEFAHANQDSRIDGAAAIYPSLNPRADEQMVRLARQEVLDDVTRLAAAEIIRVVATHQSAAIAITFKRALRERWYSIPIEIGEEHTAGNEVRSAELDTRCRAAS